jgi:hypothetical protein
MLFHFDLSDAFRPGSCVDVGGGELDCTAIDEIENDFGGHLIFAQGDNTRLA